MKSTDTHQYLLHTSCHPNHVKRSIPFNLALHIRRICSTAKKFKQRTSELLEFLCKQGHKRQYLQAQINKAFQIPCRDTLYYQSKKNNDPPVFITTYNPSLPHLNSIIRKYFPIFTTTKRGSEAFKDAPFIAYRCPKNLSDFLVKAKLKQPSQNNKPSQTLFLVVMLAAVALANLSVMVFHPIPENNIKSHKICPALQTTSYT